LLKLARCLWEQQTISVPVRVKTLEIMWQLIVAYGRITASNQVPSLDGRYRDSAIARYLKIASGAGSRVISFFWVHI
jgi:hypothetical protein